MDPEAAFLSTYALALVAAAAGLAWLSRRSTDPSASRMLAAGRPPDATHPQGEEEADWPHSEAPVFYLGVSGVALAAALMLVAASVVRNHRPLELALQVALLGLIAVRIAGIVAQLLALRSAPGETRLSAQEPTRTARRRPPGQSTSSRGAPADAEKHT